MRFISLLLISFFTFSFLGKSQINYDDLKNWVAHPDVKDAADFLPSKQFKDRQQESDVDVFYIYPTIYKDGWKDGQLNADLDNEKLSNKIAVYPVQNQASIFNGVGRIYAPYYRQANIKAYYKLEKDHDRAMSAFHLAYADVKAAFEYYMKNWNEGRPFIIASHSQGTTHSTRLIKELIDGTPLQKQLVVAYLVGMPVNKNFFENIVPCESAEQTNCFCSWRTFTRDHYPKKYPYGDTIACTNPINWKADNTYADYSENKGSIARKFKMEEELTDAEVHQGMLWIGKLNIKGAWLLRRKNWHIADFNFYWVNVRENAKFRAEQFAK